MVGVGYTHVTQIRIASVINVLAGLWILFSPFFLNGYSGPAMGNNVIVGGLIVINALPRYFGAYDSASPSWLNAVLGIWLCFSPWAFGLSNRPEPTWNNVLLGLIVAAVGIWSALATRTSHPRYFGMP